MRHMENRVYSESFSIDRQLIRLLSKLPDRNNRAQTQKRVNRSFHDAPAPLFRANQERVCRFMFVVHNMRPSFYDEDDADFSFCLNAGDRSSLTFERWMQRPDGLDSN